ncbi:MAG: tRNA preQ1(34) S-adenosylmethionine ribosyltransferase-isomerase QueA [Acidobacteriota bacterium]|jgi:S-adenosylmethionine:tRNA ribosyltransferase-isomerase|nr:tRNA preQ1(34) S-adenosylmethionine ribosyltransferase-isomerase QueA [Acidobacteriota bacterium]
MQISEFDYELPEELIAQNPLEKREISRMLVANYFEKTLKDEQFFNFPKYLRKGDVIVLNNTKVFPARLFGQSETGAKVELFLVEEIENKIWETLARPAKRLKTGKKIIFSEDLSAEVLEKTLDGRVVVKFQCSNSFDEIVDRIGNTPLPPYIKRDEDNLDKDRKRYQTVYAKKRGAIAAPTAGLHFTPEILDEIKSRGVEITEITLHVGYGTFEPVRVENLSEHKVMAEKFEISPESAEILNFAKSQNRRIIAIGTTTTRALETTVSKNNMFLSGRQTADLTITPGYKFKAIDGLLTNFHLPKSSLLVLVSTFGGYNFIMKNYKHAVREKYRFYSYGDCMLIL